MLISLKERARKLKTELIALASALSDPRTPFVAKLIIALVVAYAASPIDLIPDFIPVLGQLDDLILLPAGIALAIRLIPAEVLEEHRQNAAEGNLKGGWIAAVFIFILWAVLLIAIIMLFNSYIVA